MGQQKTKRPYGKSTLKDLRQAFEANRESKKELRVIIKELKLRATPRAIQLQEEIKKQVAILSEKKDTPMEQLTLVEKKVLPTRKKRTPKQEQLPLFDIKAYEKMNKKQKSFNDMTNDEDEEEVLLPQDTVENLATPQNDNYTLVKRFITKFNSFFSFDKL